MKILRSLGIILVVAVLTVASAWRWHHDAAIRAQWQIATVGTAPGENKTVAAVAVQIPAISKNAQVAAPMAAPVPASGPPPTATGSGKYHARAEVSATIADMIPVLESGDFAGFYMNFMPPQDIERLTSQGRLDDMMQRMQQDPNLQVEVKIITQTLRSIQNLTPTYNDAGDQATYTIDPPPEFGPPTLRFKKVDGLWYMN